MRRLIACDVADRLRSFLNKIDGSPATSIPDPDALTKGEASDAISQGLEAAKQASPRGASGAAEDTTPGDKKPTGPSAKQAATNNQKVRAGDRRLPS